MKSFFKSYEGKSEFTNSVVRLTGIKDHVSGGNLSLLSRTTKPGDNPQQWNQGEMNIDFYLEKIDTIENCCVFKHDKSGIIVFKAKMAIDADGCPRAYGPKDCGLDSLVHGLNDLVRDVKTGRLATQKAMDPNPGFYISTTSVQDTNRKDLKDPLRYVDSEKVPYIALPPRFRSKHNVKFGDFAYVFNTKTNTGAYAFFADSGPKNSLGEGSMYLALQLGINPNPRGGRGGGGESHHCVIYVVFPNSGSGRWKLRTLKEINANGNNLLNKLGGQEIINYWQSHEMLQPTK